MTEARRKPEDIACEAWYIMLATTIIQVLLMQVANNSVWSFNTLWLSMWIVTGFFMTLAVSIMSDQWRGLMSGVVFYMFLEIYIEYINRNNVLPAGFADQLPYVEGPIIIAIVGTSAATILVASSCRRKFHRRIRLPFAGEMA